MESEKPKQSKNPEAEKGKQSKQLFTNLNFKTMKKLLQNLMLATILLYASTSVNAQQWLTNGNTHPPGPQVEKLGTLNAYDLRIITNGNTRMTVKKNNGRVGINTIAPVNKLEVDVTDPEDGIRIVQNGANGIYGAASLHLKNNTLGGKMWSIHSLGSGNTNQGSGNFLIEEADDYMQNNVDRFLIQKGTGYVGIGTSLPNDKVEINSGLTARSGLRFTQLTALTPTSVIPADFDCRKVLTVDNNGEVILMSLDSCGQASSKQASDDSQLAIQQAQIDDLKSQIAELKAMIGYNSSFSAKTADVKKAYLVQISPNPLSQKATVSYSLPADALNAQLSITDATGKVVIDYTLSAGSTEQVIDAGKFSSGVYQYSLFVNGKVMDSKQLVIAK